MRRGKSTKLLAAIVVAFAASAGAQTTAPADTTDQHVAPAVVPSAQMAEGEVRKVDKETGKLTLRHGPIDSLGMPGMTMVFRVADQKMLDSLKDGDKVRFAAERVNGFITVTAILRQEQSPPQ